MTAPSPGGAQRCKPWMVDPGDDRAPYAAMRPHEQGDWVRYGDIAGMAGENERLRRALEKFGVHGPLCTSDSGQCPEFCDCGLSEALRGAAGEVSQ